MKNNLKRPVEIIKLYKNWFDWPFTKLLNKPERKVILRNGAKFYVRTKTTDLWTIEEIWNRKYYNPTGFEINNKDIVIDIGGHIGSFTVYAGMFAKEGFVYSYEPITENLKFLERNVSINQLNNVKIFNLGVLGKTCIAKIFMNEENTGGHSMFEERTNFIKIPCTTLAEIFKLNKINKCDFLKIDCEGAEYDILMNAKKSLLNKISKIALEYHNFNTKVNTKDKEKTLAKFLEKSGFEVSILELVPSQGMLYAKKS